MRATALLALLLAPFAAAEKPDPLQPVREAAAFVAAQAREDPASGGVVFPEYAESVEAPKDTLYAGGAGVLVFLENAAAVLGDEHLAALADRTAAALAFRSRRAGPAGLYTGDAGIGQAFLVRARLRDDADARTVAGRIAAALVARQKADGSWDTSMDVIAGAAGTVLFLLDAAQDLGNPNFRAAALRGARWLAAGGIEDGERAMRWPARVGSERHYPNFSHGTSGVAYALARVAAATGDAKCLAAAEAGAKLLLDRAVREDGTLGWFHYEPGHESILMEGWCHGPSGTGRLFLLLASLTGDPEYRTAAVAAGDWIRRRKPIAETTRFYSPSLCCGVAGVLDFFVDLARSTGRREDREYAEFAGRALLKLSKPDGNSRKWTNYDRPDEDGVIWHGTSLMLGAAGEGLALLRLATIDRETDPVAWLPDRPVAAPATSMSLGDEEPPPPARPAAATAAADGTRYVVLTNRNDPDDPYVQAAMELARWRKGELLTDFDPTHPENHIPVLRELGARTVAIVLAPGDIDTNTQRRFLMAACRLDDDIFPDVAWGYITGTAKTSPLEMVERAKRMEREGIEHRWVKVGVGVNYRSYVTETTGDPTARAAGFTGRSVWLGHMEEDPDVLEFATAELAKFAGGGVLSITGCGDPEGIWLFDDERNRHRELHWPFDPAKVGRDPDGEMPRITARVIGSMKLPGAILWTGVCHLGSLDRVFVEGDIVSTFGRVEHHTEYRIPPGRSVGAALLDTGLAALVAPAGPNHGYSCLMEAQVALEGRLSLGDVMRYTACEIALACGESPQLGIHLPEHDRVDAGIAAIMRGGAANRLLYGDPGLRPFEHVEVAPAVAVRARTLQDGAREVVAEVRRRDFLQWNIYGGDGNRDRVRVVTDWPAPLPRAVRATATATAQDGTAIELGAVVGHVERIDGRCLVHLQASAPGKRGLGEVGCRVIFRAVPAK